MKFSKFALFVFMLVMACWANQCSAISCYYCKGTTGSPCAYDPFNGAHVDYYPDNTSCFVNFLFFFLTCSRNISNFWLLFYIQLGRNGSYTVRGGTIYTESTCDFYGDLRYETHSCCSTNFAIPQMKFNQLPFPVSSQWHPWLLG